MSVYRIPVDYVDLNSPVEVVAAEIEQNPLGNLCFVTLRNLERLVLEVRLSVFLFDEAGRPMGQIPYIDAVMNNLAVAPHQEFGGDCPIQIGMLRPATIRVEVVSVVNDNGKGINRTRNIVPMLPAHLVNPADLRYLHIMAGKDAINLFSQNGTLWRCVCGRTNALTQKTCMRCRRDFDIVSKYDMEGLMARSAVERRSEQANMPPPPPVLPPPPPDYQNVTEDPLHTKRKRVSVGAVFVILLCLVVLGAGGYFAYDYGLVGPGQSYRQGQTFFEQGRFPEAQATFESIVYKDSAQMARYAQAHELKLRGKLKEAADIFEEMGDFKESAELKDVCRFERMEACLQNGDYADALEMLRLLGSYNQADEKLNECILNAAGELLRKGDPTSARALFEEISLNFSVSDRIMECDYQIASNDEENGEYGAAIERFTTISKYRDSSKRAREAKYLWAKSLAQKEDYKKAVELFGELGDYKDARDQFNETCYVAGSKLMAAGKTDAAKEFFNMIPDYKDAASFGIGKEEYEYRKAGDLRVKGRYSEASAAYLALGTYRDSAQLAVMCQDDGTAEGAPFSQLKAMLQKLKALGTYTGAAERVAADKYIKVRLEGAWQDEAGNYFRCTLSGDAGYYCESNMPMYEGVAVSRFRGYSYEVGREETDYRPQFEFIAVGDREITVINHTDSQTYTLSKQ